MKQGWTQPELANAVGCATITIKKLESGQRRPSPTMARRIASYLGVADEELESFLRFARQPQSATAPNASGFTAAEATFPASLNSFHGRETELALLQPRLADPETRLLTLLGPPGIGKTRLAIHVARESAQLFDDNIVWVDLAQAMTPSDVEARLNVAFKLPETANSFADSLDQLSTLFAGQRLLLILDNCEQVVAARTLITTLLATVASVTILATSRRPWHIYGEFQYTLTPLALPTEENPTTFKDNATVQLFLARARAVQPSFTLRPELMANIISLLEQTEGLPLLVELAAAQLKYVPLQMLADATPLITKLADVTVTNRPVPDSLTNMIERSISLLRPSQQALFVSLSVFAGGFTLPAALEFGTQEDLTALIDASLIHTGNTNPANYRYQLLNTIRVSASKLLSSTERADSVRETHAHYFCQFAAQAHEAVHSGDVIVWQNRLSVEIDNITAALNWCQEKQAALGLELALHMWNYWYLWGQHRAGANRLLGLLACYPEPDLLRARALRGTGVLLTRMGQYIEARPLFVECLKIATACEAIHAIGTAFMGIADSYKGLGESSAARPHYERAYSAFMQNGSLLGQSWAQAARAENALVLDNDPETAWALMCDCVRVGRLAGDPRHLAWMLGIQADMARDLGHNDLIEPCLYEAQRNFAQVNDQPGQAYIQLRLGGWHLARGQADIAATSLRNSLALARQTFVHSYSAQALALLALIALQQQNTACGVELFAAANTLVPNTVDKLT
ncbi:MAG: tetratricopeptide repeat protein, partial [Anaerolineales bacterium]|nr:tetratricopeptide repeat protein [Anaerolineales bacterium]